MGAPSRGQAPLIWVELEAGGRRYDLPVNPWRPIASTITGSPNPGFCLPGSYQGWHRLWIQQDEGERFDNALVVAPGAFRERRAAGAWPFSCTPCGHTGPGVSGSRRPRGCRRVGRR